MPVPDDIDATRGHRQLAGNWEADLVDTVNSVDLAEYQRPRTGTTEDVGFGEAVSAHSASALEPSGEKAV